MRPTEAEFVKMKSLEGKVWERMKSNANLSKKHAPRKTPHFIVTTVRIVGTFYSPPRQYPPSALNLHIGVNESLPRSAFQFDGLGDDDGLLRGYSR